MSETEEFVAGDRAAQAVRPPLPQKPDTQDVEEPDALPVSPWVERHKWPLILSGVWIAALGAYSVGFLSLYDPAGGAIETPLLLNLLFFCFALFGPLAMLWASILVSDRSAGLADRVREQSAVAARLGEKLGAVEALLSRQHRLVEDTFGTTVRNLEKKVEETATEMVGTVGLLTDDASEILTKRGAGIEQTLGRIENTISARLDDRLSAVDSTLSAGTKQIEHHLVGQLALLNELLNERVSTLDKTIADGQVRVARLIEAQEGGTREVFDQTTEEVAAGLRSSGDRISEELQLRVKGLDDTLTAESATLKTAIADQITAMSKVVSTIEDGLEQRLASHQELVTSAVDQRLAKFHEAVSTTQAQSTKVIETLTDRIDRELNSNRSEMEAAFNRRGENLETQNRMLEVDLPRNIDQIDRTVKDMAQVLAQHPPPSVEMLAEQLGATAQHLVAPERKALSDMTGRMRKLEEQAQALIAQLDRTSRMNAAFERPPFAGEASPATEGPGLPLGDPPSDIEPRPLDWTFVIRALDLPDPGSEATRPIQREIDRDRALKGLIAWGRSIEAALAEDGLFLRDLVPEHASASTWMSYASGARDKAMVKELAGLADEVALTLARTRLRGDVEFRDLALRFVAGYQRLIARAADEGFQGSHMMELAETKAGRAFLLLGQLTGAFEPAPDIVSD